MSVFDLQNECPSCHTELISDVPMICSNCYDYFMFLYSKWKKEREIGSYNYTKMNNLYVCKQILTENGRIELVKSEPIVGKCISCYDENLPVQNVLFGRLTGFVCDRCLNHEIDFVAKLKALPDEDYEKYVIPFRGTYAI